MNGIINVFKPKGITSHGVVNRMRRILDMKRIGHTGTLDPNVTGVLPICIGKATRISEFLLEADKEYVGELTLGIKTDTQDGDGRIIDRRSSEVKEKDIYRVFKSYQGPIKQLPPMYSAVRHNGKKLYELAREGKNVKRELRDSHIYSLDILSIIDNKIKFKVKCSKGTYIRTLCNDIGEDLSTLGYMSYLIRTGVEPFYINKAYSLEEIERLVERNNYSFLLPMDRAILDLNYVEADPDYYINIKNGMRVPTSLDADSVNLNRVYCKNEFIGLGIIIKGKNTNYIQMEKVLV